MISGMGIRVGHVPAIDGLRAVAVLAVIAYHAGLPVPGGFVGVDVFFVISGYLITRLLHDELQQSGRIDFIDFYARRARRILPAIAVVIVATLGLGAILLPPLEAMQAGKAAAASFAFAANIHFAMAPTGYFDGDIHGNPLLHLWSLGVEEQFYLAWPLILLMARRRPFLVLSLLAAASFVLAEWLVASGRDQVAFFHTPFRAWELAIGGLLAIRRPRVPGWVGYLGVVVVVAACGIGFRHFPGAGAVPAVLGAAMVIAAAGAGQRIRMLEVQPMVWVGLVSYSLYLWHWPVMVLGGGMPAWSKLVLTFLLAAGSYYFVERPFRQGWRVSARATVAVAAAAVVVGLSGSVATARHYEAIEDQGNQLFRAVADARLPLPAGCDEWYHSDTVKPCVFGPDSAARTAVLAGDSVAAQWFGAFRSIFEDAGWRFIVVTKSSCPMVDSPTFLKAIDRTYTECQVWRSRFLDWVDLERPDLVIISSSNAYGFSGEQWQEGSRSVLERLAGAGGRVVLLRSPPILSPGGNDPLDEVHRWQSEAAGGLSSVRVVDMNPLICPAGNCPRQVNGITTYRDRRHLTPVFVESLAPALLEKIGVEPLPGG